MKVNVDEITYLSYMLRANMEAELQNKNIKLDPHGFEEQLQDDIFNWLCNAIECTKDIEVDWNMTHKHKRKSIGRRILTAITRFIIVRILGGK